MRIKPTEQVYEHYTPEDFKVWGTLFNRQMEALEPLVCSEYLDALKTVQFTPEKIPDFIEVSKILNEKTGWGLTVVPNIVPAKEFFESLAIKKFTATCWIRTMEQLEYIEEPDMFHDVFAHVPLLSNQSYVDFFAGFSQMALDFHEDPIALELLGRVYWFTIEFGLMRDRDKLKIYGAGIISSHGETYHCLSNKTEKIDFDVATMINTPYRNDIMQDKYFVVESFDQLYASLPEIRKLLEEKMDGR